MSACDPLDNSLRTACANLRQASQSRRMALARRSKPAGLHHGGAMAAPGLAVRPRRNVRYGDDRMVVVCVAQGGPLN